jgi:phosphoglucosamine mutase
MERVPQVMQNITLAQRMPLEQMTALSALMAKIEKTLGDKGRLLVRWSGTEPKLRIMVEGEKREAIAEYASDLVAAAQKDAKAFLAKGAKVAEAMALEP